ncbi:DUF2911 domain-containing protein [Segetibacter sp. 3557_3]|uniref:DUF2911 domain-containing protein n=1 Tax=Segetibacter sp. 3557_3 TaxID=2547429 RepID=UPI001058DFE6|nr:DUF2911 domain-containing protein [Segetibacter sp. 3557_3]TDH25626.1 DUF2911 domain-containing protein [Segetibacter sp. 3557_3]
MLRTRVMMVLTIIVSALCTTAQVNLPAPSSTQMIRQDFGMGRIEVNYSRPSIRGRQLFGASSELAPLGKIWRTGANSATRIRFTDKVSIAGTAVDSGTYVLYTIPEKDQWQVILNKGLSNWGTDGYKESDDVARFKVPVTKVKNTETFTIQIGNVKPESCELELIWGTTAVQIPITTNIKERIRTQLTTAMAGDRKPYFQAANFYYEWDKDYPKALENINKAIEGTPDAYYMYLAKARIQKDMGDKAGARASAEKCIELAGKAKNEDYVTFAKVLVKTL